MVQLTRRAVVASAIGVTGMAALGVATATSPWARTPVAPAAAPAIVKLARSRFAPHLGLAFTARAGDSRHALVLDRIDDLPGAGSGGEEQRFNLIFAETDEALTDGIYEVSRDGAEPATLFLSVIGAEGERRLQGLVDQSV
ncbi:hypothetical protein OH146_07040 [Salinibacterium sp. SYSU T00001]|uniref:DUF6916 family protein n=1 Tax=Homoserinimonas sedimenticola TaxID=2986805 RepID=UPI0022366DB7|nr:hypothetical protein [Salinibacterium sedimenticola]MCW4385526.1 hypothetical protein [Salinibacterium sedimenticola]